LAGSFASKPAHGGDKVALDASTGCSPLARTAAKRSERILLSVLSVSPAATALMVASLAPMIARSSGRRPGSSFSSVDRAVANKASLSATRRRHARDGRAQIAPSASVGTTGFSGGLRRARLAGSFASKPAHGGDKVALDASTGCSPLEIDDAAIAKFIGDVRKGSLHHNPNVLHQKTAMIWNEVRNALPQLGLHPVTRPSFRGPPKRVDWAILTNTFRADVEKYLFWCEAADVFAADARPRPLAPRTLKLRRNQIHAAVTALVESGSDPASIQSVADLVSVDAFKCILRRRHEAVAGSANSFNRDLAELLVQIAREWAKVDAEQLTELKRLANRVPMPASGLTTKNKHSLRQFDDPAARLRLQTLPARLWTEVKRDQKPNFRTLAKAQAALAIAILRYIPLRSQNLHALMFDVHVFLHDDIRATSSLEIPSEEVKNKIELAFDIPPHVAKMLIEYRDRIAPKVIGQRPKRLFVNANGTPKSQAMVALLVKTYLRKRAGIELTSHQFRHLCGKTMLDADPGNFETLRQVLGHKDRRTTTRFYAGIDSRRAARHHQYLIDRALAEQIPPVRRRKRKKDSRPNNNEHLRK
jgi:integrase